ncbi:MAG TPA: hypothetical protein VMA95_16515 [Streptosporangiaceae bacterium]|nr:hypothetical protein [Streptosporangiaceae bacterium]
MTPSEHFELPSKQTWLIVATAFWAFGAAAWLIIGRRDVRMRAVCNEVTGDFMFGPQASLWSAPHRGSLPGYLARGRGPEPQPVAGLTEFIAPDDNPEFLLELGRRIKGTGENA